MDNDKITTIAQALEFVGINTQQNGEYLLFDDVMCELQEKWHSLDHNKKQKIANAFVRCFL